jgi:NADP-dependent 3-hydroxy acid dehydrogenase YdfG
VIRATTRHKHGNRIEALAKGLGDGALAIEADVTDRSDLVNIPSVAGRVAGPGSGVYSATKWGSTAGPNPSARSCCPMSASR